MKKCRVLLLLLLLSACGFQPLYVEKKHNNAWYFSGDFDTSITREMSQIKVEPIEERFGQIVRNELLDSLIIQQALRNDITATREQVRYRVDYILYDAQSDEELVRGNSIAYSSYDIMSNPYSTTIAEKKGEKDCAQIIANDIALRLGAYFHSRKTGVGDSSAI